MSKKEYIKPPQFSTSFSQSGKNARNRFDNILIGGKGKIGIIVIGIILVLCLVVSMCVIFNNQKLDEKTINAIIQDSYLDILVNIDDYSKDNIDKENLLEAGMRIAHELNLVKEGENITGGYAQYVLETDMVKILTELTGMQMSDPIIFDYKYYYKYNPEYKCYDIIPMGTDWIHLDTIKSIKKDKNIYSIEVSAKNSIGGYMDYVDSVKIELEYIPSNELVKYRINSITSTQRLWVPENATNINYDKIVSSELVEEKAKQYIFQNYNMTAQTPARLELYYSENEFSVYSIQTNGDIDIKDRLCWCIEYTTSDLILGPIIIYFDAYTGDVLGIGYRD